MTARPDEPARVLIVRLGAIGDVTNALVVANALRDAYPGCFIGWAVHPLSAPLVEGHPSIDRVHVWPRGTGVAGFRALRREIVAEGYGVAIDLQRLQKSSLVARLSGAPRVLGFDRARAKELSWIWTRERIETGPRREHMVRQYMRFSRLLGLQDATPRRSLPAPEAAAAFAEGFVTAHGAPLLLNLGASRPDKLWPPSFFRELAAGLIASPLPGFDGPLVLTGGPGDRGAADEVARDLDVHDLVGRTSLPELWALCARSRAMVSADTGPMHLCAAVGTPTVALFGPGDPARTGPYGREHVVLVAGRPLTMEDESVSLDEEHTPAAMAETTPHAVRTALEQLLGAGGVR